MTTEDRSDSRHVQELTERATALDRLADRDGLDCVSVAVVPNGHRVALLDREQLEEAPDRRRGSASFAELDPLVRYLNTHQDDRTTVWVHYDPDARGTTSAPVGRIEAVLDDHTPGHAAWGEHRAELPLRTTPEWQHWLSQDGELLGQVDFSDHLRQGLPEITDPDSATILEVAEHLVVHESDSLVSVQRSSGEMQIEHNVEQTARRKGGTETTPIPEAMTLHIAPFVGAPVVAIEARLRWRKRGDVLLLGYTLVRPQEALRTAFHGVHATLVENLATGVDERVYLGAPIGSSDRRRVLRGPATTT